MDDQWSSELFIALIKWFDLLVLSPDKTICLHKRSQRTKLLLAPDYWWLVGRPID
jgi:hypothetical protein